jgi:DNA-binding CsgD family transcriptional regulator
MLDAESLYPIKYLQPDTLLASMVDRGMSDPIAGWLDSARLLFDLQQANEIAQSFSGCLEPEAIADSATDGLVKKFDCALARIWLLEPDQAVLRLVASSGMYTHVNGSFARVPMGAYKVGKIAQNRVPFLSNHLADESWVKDRNWAIANQIRGFAGYPLTVGDRVIGVLATFSHTALAPEFLEVLQTLCATVTIALDAAMRHQQERQVWQSSNQKAVEVSLSDQLAGILRSPRLTLVGTEQPLSFSLVHLFLQTAEVLNAIDCAYCRLTYGTESVVLEAIVTPPDTTIQGQQDWVRSIFGNLLFTASCLGGVLETKAGVNQSVVQVVLKVPYPSCAIGLRLQVQCQAPVLQFAFTQLAYLAGMMVCEAIDPETPLLTDDLTQLQTTRPILWVRQGTEPLPKGIHAAVMLSIQPGQLRAAVEAVKGGETWGLELESEGQKPLSDREQEILTLLAKGLRDREIASNLFISESTVKFHMNNLLTKLKARTRYQALHLAIVNGWLRS